MSRFKGLLDNGYKNMLGLSNFSQGVKTAIVDYYVIKPYSDDLKKETNSDSQRDKTKYADLTLVKNTTVNYAPSGYFYEHVVKGEKNTVLADVMNRGAKDFAGNVSVKFEVVDSKNMVINTKTYNFYATIKAFDYCRTKSGLKFDTGSLPEGEYTVRITVSSNTKEAYLYNNTVEQKLSVISASAVPKCELNCKITKYYTENKEDFLVLNLKKTGFEKTVAGDTTAYHVFYKRYINGSWEDWSYYDGYLGQLDFEDTMNLHVLDKMKVKFMIIVNMREKGTFSVESNEISLSAPVIKKVTKVKAVNSGKNKVKVTFAKSKNAKKYKVVIYDKKSSKKITKTTTSNKIEFKKLKKGKTYYVKVMSIYGKYTSSWTKPVKVKIKK